MHNLPTEPSVRVPAPGDPTHNVPELINIDRASKLNQLLGANIFLTTVNTFILEARLDSVDLLSAIDSEAHSEIARISHQIRGGSATVGCTQLTSLLAKIEQAAKNVNSAEVSFLASELQEIIDRSIDALTDYIALVR